MGATRPGWQVEGLEEEWIEQSIEIDEQDFEGQSIIELSGGRFDDPYPGLAPGSNHSTFTPTFEPNIVLSPQAGTFVVRGDQPPMQLDRVKRQDQAGKHFFSPLALERLFEPPLDPSPGLPTTSPSPALSRYGKSTAQVFAPSKLAHQLLLDPTLTEIAEDEEPTNTTRVTAPREEDTILDTDMPNIGAIDGKVMPSDYQFTFSPPTIAATSTPMSDGFDSTQPNPLKDALTDPRLKLFQLNYDTYTREHLSAIVDSIPITPSRSGSADVEVRNPKRIRLTPSSETDGNDGMSPLQIKRRDYIGESKSLMNAIRQNTRSVSLELSETEKSRVTATTRKASNSTVVGSHSLLTIDSLYMRPESAPAALTAGAYRQNAAAFMSAIKSSLQNDGSHIRGYSTSSVASAVEKENLNVTEIMHKSHTQESMFTHEKIFGKSDCSSRRPLKRLTTTDEMDREIATNFSVLSISVDITSSHLHESILKQTPLLILPTPERRNSRSFAPLEIMANPVMLGSVPNIPPVTDPTSRTTSQMSSLNRFISTSTTTAASSVPSLVKHQGHPQIKMTNITPADVPNLGDKVSGMKYDPHIMKWVKERSPNRETAEESEDVFRDIESLSTSRSRRSHKLDDASSLNIADACLVEVMTGVSSIDLNKNWSPSSDDEDIRQPDELSLYPETLDGSDTDDGSYRPPPEDEEPVSSSVSSDEDAEPFATHSETSSISSSFRSANNNTQNNIGTPLPHRRPEIVPRSALKSASATPVAQIAQGGHRRSVSFSDGRKAGRIQGLHTDESESPTATESSVISHERNQTTRGTGLMSARTKGIQARLDELINDSLGSTPNKMMKPKHAHRYSFPISSAQISTPDKSIGYRQFGRSPSIKANTSVAKGNATFLTECSFGVAHDKLVQIITDVQPFEPYWESLSSINFAQKGLESTARLKEFLPNLVDLNLDENRLAWLSGLPSSLRRLSAKSNLLTGLTSYTHIRSLEVLDISGNEIDNLSQLSGLERLRELSANSNLITSLDDLKGIMSLTHLSLRSNKIMFVEFTQGVWPSLCTLDLSDNVLSSVKGIHRIPSLQTLTLEKNNITDFKCKAIMPVLQVLRLSSNRLKKLDVAPFPRLRTLYLDHNSCELAHLDELRHLRNFSMRYQRLKTLSRRSISLSGCKYTKRAYLSGNNIIPDVKSTICSNLVYLELAGCQLIELPTGFSESVPNVEVLNLNYNFLTDMMPLTGLSKLRKLTVVGSRMTGTKAIVRVVRNLPLLELVDFRMNPATLEFYLPLMIIRNGRQSRSNPGGDATASSAIPGGCGGAGASSASTEKSWSDQDARFRHSLPDQTYVKRMAYRGILMRICPRLQILDGVTILAKERKKAEMLLEGLENV